MYFIAIVCPPVVNEQVLNFKLWMKERFGCIVALKSPAHITLVAPHWFNAAEAGILMDAFEHFSSSLPPVEIGLDGFDHFRRRVLFVNVPENGLLATLQKETGDYFRERLPHRVKKENRPFHPHITIATRDLQPSQFEKAWIYFEQKKFSDSFVARSISLLMLHEGRWSVIREKAWGG
jgi:2'-5' RNA ligase